MRIAVDAVEQEWRKTEAGVWELDARSWTHSNLICVAGLRRTAGFTMTSRCSALADAILAETTRIGLHPRGRWQRSPDDASVDAALLLPALRGALPADDPRTIATVRAVQEDLARDGYVYRFRHDDRELGAAEGAFLICGFWLALAEQQQGETVAAARRFERNRASCGPPGLFTEEYDVRQRQLRGNLPQAFVHGMLLECSARLASEFPGNPTGKREV
jgi:GH15 family glucan-1,4-alpha-glucosidase